MRPSFEKFGYWPAVFPGVCLFKLSLFVGCVLFVGVVLAPTVPAYQSDQPSAAQVDQPGQAAPAPQTQDEQAGQEGETASEPVPVPPPVPESAPADTGDKADTQQQGEAQQPAEQASQPGQPSDQAEQMQPAEPGQEQAPQQEPSPESAVSQQQPAQEGAPGQADVEQQAEEPSSGGAEQPEQQPSQMQPEPEQGMQVSQPQQPQVEPAVEQPVSGQPEVVQPELPPAPPGAEAELPSEESQVGLPSDQERRIVFNFKYQPWADVLEWFAEQAGLSLVMEGPPHGTFNYMDDRAYTPAEAIDLLNSVLLTKGYTLVRRGRMLILVNLEDGVPPNLVRIVPPEELDNYGDYELVSTMFPLQGLNAEEVEEEIRKLLGPQGSVAVLAKAGQVLVTETAGRLRMIRRMLEEARNPSALSGQQVRVFSLQYVMPDEVMEILRQLLNIPEDEYATEDGSLRLALDRLGMRILATGVEAKVKQVEQIIKTIDVPAGGMEAATQSDVPPQLEVYTVAPADPNTALQVLQTLLAGTPGVRLATDPETGNLIALARPAEHATIRATLEQLRREATRVEVIKLRRVDPERAAAAIRALLGEEGDEESASTRVEVDALNRQLLVRASEAELERIRTLLGQLGESDQPVSGSDSRVRVLPLYGPEALRVVEQIQRIWPAIRPNPIRVVTPAGAQPFQPSLEQQGLPGETQGIPRRLPSPYETPRLRLRGEPGMSRQSTEPPATLEQRGTLAPLPRTAPGSTTEPNGNGNDGQNQVGTDGAQKSVAQFSAEPELTMVAFVQDNRAQQFGQGLARPDQLQSEPADSQAESARDAEEQPTPPESTPRSVAQPAPPVVIAVGPNGVTIASEDVEALNALEELLYRLGGAASPNTPQFTIYYLKYATADTVAQTLSQLASGSAPVGGTSSSSTSSSGSSLSAGAEFPVGPIQITPDTRLNALIVRAVPQDLLTIEQLLRILDQPDSPEEVAAHPKPRVVPVYHARAEEIAEVVRQVYQDRLVTGQGGQQQAPRSPEEFFRLMASRFGRGGSRGGTAATTERLSIGVDSRTNSIIVSAPEPLFQEVKSLIEQLDQAAAVEETQVTQVISVRRVNPEVLREVVGTIASSSSPTGGTRTPSRGTTSSSSGSSSSFRPFGPFGGFRPPFFGRPPFGGSSSGFRGPFGGSSSSRSSSFRR